jgi:hypothetical protein
MTAYTVIKSDSRLDPNFKIYRALEAPWDQMVGPQMRIELIAFLGSVAIATTLIAKVYELHQDVLYGPYIQGRHKQHYFYGAMDQT